MLYNNNLLLESFKYYSKIIPVENLSVFNNELRISVKKEFLKFVILFFKLHTFLQYKTLCCITGADYISKKFRFEVYYELLSTRFNNRIRIKVSTNEIMGLDSCEGIHSTANWYECEVWDMYGIFFINHSNLRRILTDYGFVGNPLRKDFPLSGFIEVRYNESQKRVISDQLELSQEYRTFNFISPWESSSF